MHRDAELGGHDLQAFHDELLPKVEAARTKRESIAPILEMIDLFDQSHFSIVPAYIYESL